MNTSGGPLTSDNVVHENHGKVDRAFVCVFIAYYALGLLTNLMRTFFQLSDLGRNLIGIAGIIIVMVWTLFISYFMKRGLYRRVDIGFPRPGKKTILLLVIALSSLVVGALRFGTIAADKPPLAIALVVALVIIEEIVFRSMLINFIQRAFQRSSDRIWLSVTLSAIIWASAHVASHPWTEVFGLFISGIIFGVLYQYTKSNMVGFTLHSMSNAGVVGGVIALVYYFVIGQLLGRWRSEGVAVSVDPHDKS
jgi:membrane protease YdiL (CAAX protease family)